MLEIARFTIVINTGSGGRHLTTEQEDINLGNSLIYEFKEQISSSNYQYISIGDVSNKKGCLEVCVPLLVDVGNILWSGVEIAATIGGLIQFIGYLDKFFTNKKLKGINQKEYLSTVYKLTTISDKELLGEIQSRLRNKANNKVKAKEHIRIKKKK